MFQEEEFEEFDIEMDIVDATVFHKDEDGDYVKVFQSPDILICKAYGEDATAAARNAIAIARALNHIGL